MMKGFEKMGKTIKKVLRIFAYSAILIIVSIILFGVYYEAEKRLLDRKHLNYRTNFEWTWWDEYHRIQKRYDESEKRTILRNVDLENQTEIMMNLSDDYGVQVTVSFFIDCTPGTFIKTTKKWWDGTPKKLTCKKIQINKVPYTYLTISFSFIYSNKFIPVDIKGNLDGFKYDVGSLTNWKLDELKKEITLLRAQPKK